MGLGLKRTNLRQLAETKREDAQLLLANKRYSTAYYIAGYAVEIGLKACIAKQFAAEVIPERAFVNQIHTHNIRTLVGLAGLSPDLKAREDADLNFAANFAFAAQWGPEVRYEIRDATAALTMMRAIDDPNSGVLPWIRLHW